MQNNFRPCADAVWEFDGVKDDEAPGEKFITTYGITSWTWKEAIEAGIIADKSQSLCTPDDARTILHALYWNKMHCDEFAAGVDLMVFDFGMMAGNTASVRCLQRCVAEAVDGIVGPHTLQAVAKARPAILIEALRMEHLRYLEDLENWPQFAHGWTRRQNVMADTSQKMYAANLLTT